MLGFVKLNFVLFLLFIFFTKELSVKSRELTIKYLKIYSNRDKSIN